MSFDRGPDLGTGSGDVALIQGNLTGADINKTLALGTFLRIAPDQLALDLTPTPPAVPGLLTASAPVGTDAVVESNLTHDA